MPRYRVTTADGATHEINGPEGATRQQVIAAVETLLAEEAIDIKTSFTDTSNGSFTASGVSTKTGVFTQTSAGSLLFVEIDPDADESYTTITPSGTETWTEIEV